MPLPTTKTPVKTSLADLTVLLYGPPKIGKTTMAAGADHALFLATEPGLNHLEAYQMPINSWEEMLDACADIVTTEHDFRTIIIDTIDNAYSLCADYICRQWKLKHISDMENNKGYSLACAEFTRVLNKLALLPYGLYLISHAKQIDVKTRTAKYPKWVPSLSGKPREAVLSLVDMILYADIEEEVDPETGNPVERRVLRTKPTNSYEAGDRTGRLPDTLPLDYEAFAHAFEESARIADPFHDQ
jgi:hypothetical protein